jgi:hypothetical protein
METPHQKELLLMSSLKQNGSTTAWRKIRAEVLFRDNYTCQWCGADANTVDHVIERSQGGTDSMDNLIAACNKCNYGRIGRKAQNGGFFSTAGTPLTLPVSFIPENGSKSHD